MHLFGAAPAIVVRCITLSTSPISKLSAADDEQRNSLADRPAVEAKTLADLKIERPSSRACAAPPRLTGCGIWGRCLAPAIC
jgi:hypothetical protein